MEVWLNGRQLDDEAQGVNLLEILEHLVADRLGDDNTFKEVRINGLPYDEAAMGAPAQVSRASIDRLEVETLPARQVALHFMANAEAFLQVLNRAALKVAELFRVADEREASEQYLGLLESLQLFLQVLQMSRSTLELDFDRTLEDGVTAEERLQRLSILVQEMLASQEQEDWVLLADLLQYDLTGELAAWGSIMPQLKEQVLS